jgi:hypothetical protein
VVHWLVPARKRLERGVMYENNTSSAVGLRLRSGALSRFFVTGNPGFKQPAAV